MSKLISLVADILSRSSLVILLLSVYVCFALITGSYLNKPVLITFALLTILGIVGSIISRIKEVSELNKSVWFFPGDVLEVRDTAISFFANRRIKKKYKWTVEAYDYSDKRIHAINENGQQYTFTHHEVSLLSRNEKAVESARTSNKDYLAKYYE